MKESSRMPLFDLKKLNASLPVPKPKENWTNVLVLGAKDDFIVVRDYKTYPSLLPEPESFKILVCVLNQSGLWFYRTTKD